MATAAELLAARASGTSTVDKTLVIDNYFRMIQIPSSITNLGVENDDDVLRLNFKMPRYLGKTDLSTFSVRINYLNAKGESDVYTVSDLAIVGDNLTFSWLVGPTATKYKGNTKFNVCMRIVDADAYIQKEYNTTIATLPVLEGLECEESVVEYYSDILEQWRRELFGIGDTEETKLQEKSEEEQQKIVDKGIEVLATIPEDYQTTYEMANNAYRTRANAIVSTEQGEIIKLTDSSNDPLRGLRVFGKTTQITTTGAQLLDFNPDVRFDATESYAHVAVRQAPFSRGGTYYYSCTGTIGSSYKMWAYDSNENLLINIPANQSFILTDEEAVSIVKISVVIQGTSPGIAYTGYVYPMINEGSTALPYEPYTGSKVSPSPNYPQELESIDSAELKVHGKNLLHPKNNVVSGYTAAINDDGSVTVTGAAATANPIYLTFATHSVDDPLVLSRDHKYYMWGESSNGRFIGTKTLDSNGNAAWSTAVNWNKHVGTDYMDIVQIYIESNGHEIGDTSLCGTYRFQLEVGDSFTGFEGYKNEQPITLPYTLRGIPVESGGNYTDSNGQQWICDEIDFERGVYVQRVAMKVFDGTETTWRLHATLLTFMVDWPGADGGWELNHAMSSHFECGTEAYSNTIGYFAFDSKGLGYFATEHTTLDDFLAWMRENPVTVIAKLATPIETELTAEELVAFGALHTNYPNTTILNDAGACMEVKYNEDLKFYADEIMQEAAETVITQDKIQAAVDAWLAAHYSTAEGVSF